MNQHGSSKNGQNPGDGKIRKQYKMNIGKGAKNKGAIFNPLKLPDITPIMKCRLRLNRLERVKDLMLIEQEFVETKER